MPIPDRDERARLAEDALNTLDRMATQGTASPSSAEVYQWSRRLVEAKASPNVPEAERRAALQIYRDRMQKRVAFAEQLAKTGSGSQVDVLEAKYRLIEADRWLRNGKVGDLGDVSPPGQMDPA